MQLQRCLRHWTLLELKWPVQDVGFVVPLLALSKFTHKKLWETTLNRGEEEYGCFYLTYVWISLIWSKKDIVSSESRRSSWLLKVEVCNMLLVCSYRLVCSGRELKQGNVYEFKNLGILGLLLIGWESGASFVSQWQSVKWTYQSSKHIIICSDILWDKWRACLQTNVHWKT